METETVKHPANYMEGQVLKDDLEAILQSQWPIIRELVQSWQDRKIEQLYLVGCGGSLATLKPVKWLLDRFSDLPVDLYTGWEFVTRAPVRLNEKAAVVLASHSGTTEEILTSLELANERRAPAASFSLPDTPLATGADTAITYNSIAANLSKLLLGYLVAVEVIRLNGDQEVATELSEALSNVPNLTHEAKEQTREWGHELARKYVDAEQFYVLGTGPLAGLAYQFAVCNLLEMQWKHASALNAAEFPHGPLEIVDKGLPMIFLLGTDESRFVAERAQRFAERYDADTIIIDLAELGDFHPYIAPFIAHLPLQWFNWYLGIERDRPISTRRYMGKVPYAHHNQE